MERRDRVPKVQGQGEATTKVPPSNSSQDRSSPSSSLANLFRIQLLIIAAPSYLLIV
jgi:hypothetical protein